MTEDGNHIETQETYEISNIVEVESITRETYFQLSPQVIIGQFPINNLSLKD